MWRNVLILKLLLKRLINSRLMYFTPDQRVDFCRRAGTKIHKKNSTDLESQSYASLEDSALFNGHLSMTATKRALGKNLAFEDF
jgi:hypothetical protein